jgi:hypothetical protein
MSSRNISIPEIASKIVLNITKEPYKKQFEFYSLLGFNYPELFTSLEFIPTLPSNSSKESLKNSNKNNNNNPIKPILLDSNSIGYYIINNKMYIHLLKNKTNKTNETNETNETYGFHNNNNMKKYKFMEDEYFGFNINIKLGVTKEYDLIISEFNNLSENKILINEFLKDCQCFAKISNYKNIIVKINDDIKTLNSECNFNDETKTKIKLFLKQQSSTGGFRKSKKFTKINKKIKKSKKPEVVNRKHNRNN